MKNERDKDVDVLREKIEIDEERLAKNKKIIEAIRLPLKFKKCSYFGSEVF